MSAPAGLAELDQWVNYDPATKKPTPSINRRLLSYREARRRGGVGFVFRKEDGYAGIDLDDMSGEFAQWLLAEARRRGLYVERSVSGRGWHIIGRGSLPLGVVLRELGVEAYCRGRYFIVTGKEATGDVDGDMSELLGEVWSRHQSRRDWHKSGERIAWDDKYLEVLRWIDPDSDYDTWYRVGMALQASGAGLEVWDEWSREGMKYEGEEDLAVHWRSFNAVGGIGLGTMLRFAREAGWSGCTVEDFPMLEEPGTSERAKMEKAVADGRWTQSAWDVAEEARPPVWVVEGVLEEGQIGLLIAEENVGKTFIALDMAAHTAAGEAWFGHGTCGKAALYFSGEGAAGMRRRLAVLGEHRPRLSGGPLRVRLEALTLTHRDRQELVIGRDVDRMVTEAERTDARLLVVDTLSANKGAAEENSNDDLAALLKALRARLPSHIAVLIVHHTTKDGQSWRGASALSNNTDVRLEIADARGPRGEDLGYKVLSTPRQRDARQSEMAFRLEVVEAWAGVRSCVVEPVETAARTAAEEESHQALRGAVLANLTTEWQGIRAIAGGEKEAVVRSVLHEMATEGVVEEQTSTRGRSLQWRITDILA